MYDEVGLIRSFSLAPREGKYIVLCLRPEVIAREEGLDDDPDPSNTAVQSIDFRGAVTFTAEAAVPLAPGRPVNAQLQLRAFLVRSVVKASVQQVPLRLFRPLIMTLGDI